MRRTRVRAASSHGQGLDCPSTHLYPAEREPGSAGTGQHWLRKRAENIEQARDAVCHRLSGACCHERVAQGYEGCIRTLTR